MFSQHREIQAVGGSRSRKAEGEFSHPLPSVRSCPFSAARTSENNRVPPALSDELQQTGPGVQDVRLQMRPQGGGT